MVGIAAERQLPIALELEQDCIDQRTEAARGKPAQRACHLLESPGTRDVGYGNGECRAPLETAEARRDRRGRRPVARVRVQILERCDDAAVDGIRSATPQIGHKNRLL
jgi:hypothetical protein